MRRIIAFVMATALLTAGFEVVTDLDEAWGSGTTVAQADKLTNDNAPDLPGDDTGCDHCCHAGAHLSGLIHSGSWNACAITVTVRPEITTTFSSVAPPPRLRPPIV